MKNEIYYDAYRRGGGFLYYMPQYRFVYWKRICEKYYRIKPVYYFVRLIYEHYRITYGIDIAAQTKIGRGLRIEHIGGIVINPKAVLGCNITLLNGVLIGAENRGKRKGVPTIGNEVWIGTNSIIVGNIKIGNNVLIAPGSYVNFDVPDNSIVIGNPAKIIMNKDATESYLVNMIAQEDYNN